MKSLILYKNTKDIRIATLLSEAMVLQKFFSDVKYNNICSAFEYDIIISINFRLPLELEYELSKTKKIVFFTTENLYWNDANEVCHGLKNNFYYDKLCNLSQIWILDGNNKTKEYLESMFDIKTSIIPLLWSPESILDSTHEKDRAYSIRIDSESTSVNNSSLMAILNSEVLYRSNKKLIKEIFFKENFNKNNILYLQKNLNIIRDGIIKFDKKSNYEILISHQIDLSPNLDIFDAIFLKKLVIHNSKDISNIGVYIKNYEKLLISKDGWSSIDDIRSAELRATDSEYLTTFHPKNSLVQIKIKEVLNSL